MRKTIVKRAGEYKVQEFDWGQLTWFASKELGNSDAVTVGRCVIVPGRENPRHHHPNCDEVLHVLRGKIVHTMENGQSVQMGEGDTISVPPNIGHNAKNVGDEDAVLFICFSSAERKTVGE